jgi:hypothetical protein
MNYLTKYYKNLSEQLQQRVNILENKLNKSGVNFVTESWDVHGKIVDAIITHHASKYPHKKDSKTFKPSVEVSGQHIKEILNQHPNAPFTDPTKAIEAIHPHAIKGNMGLEDRLYDKQPEVAMGGDMSELPDHQYEDLIEENEEDYAEELENKVMAHLQNRR